LLYKEKEKVAGATKTKGVAMTTKRYTKKEMFTEALQIILLVSGTGLISDALAVRVSDGLSHELEMLSRKHTGSGKVDAKRAAEATKVQDAIVSILEDEGAEMRATAIAQAVGVSVQKATAHLAKLVAAGTITRHEDKKVTTFTLA
jgi:predicted transcriptional regulator